MKLTTIKNAVSSANLLKLDKEIFCSHLCACCRFAPSPPLASLLVSATPIVTSMVGILPCGHYVVIEFRVAWRSLNTVRVPPARPVTHHASHLIDHTKSPINSTKPSHIDTMSFLFGKSKSAVVEIPDAEVYPVHALDAPKVNHNVLGWVFRFDDALDADKLKESLCRLLETGDWRKLGGRIRRNVGLPAYVFLKALHKMCCC